MNLSEQFKAQKYIYLIHYPNGSKLKISIGIIKSINNNNKKIEYLCSTDKCSIGCPIFNIINNKVIGIYIGDDFQFKLGVILKIGFNEFYFKEIFKKNDSNKKTNKDSLNNLSGNDKNNKINIDDIIKKLLSAKEQKPDFQIDLEEEEIKFIIDKSLPLIQYEEMLINLNLPIKICGDIYGQYYDLLRIFESCGYPDKSKYLFLGNYVDRGSQGLEVICLLLCYKIKYPKNIILLRGNHETSDKNRIYGFYNECKKRYYTDFYKSFNNLFSYLPVAALIERKIFCVHSGLSPELKNLWNSPTYYECSDCLLCDLLNSDFNSSNIYEYEPQDHGISYSFGEKAVKNFNENNNLKLIITGNRVEEYGYKFYVMVKF